MAWHHLCGAGGSFLFLWIAFSSLSTHAFFLLRDCSTFSVFQVQQRGRSYMIAASLLRVDASHPVVSSVALCVQRQRRLGGVVSSVRCRWHRFFCG